MTDDPVGSGFRNVLLCDDVRKEIGNKRTIVGVFSGDIIVSSVPAVVPLAAYIEFMPTSLDDNEIEFRFLVGNKPIATLKATLNDLQMGVVAVLELPKIVIHATQPTEVSIDAQIKNRPVQRLMTKKILVGPIS